MNKFFVLSALAVLVCVSAAPSGEKGGEWRKVLDNYIQECKSQLNANDEDVKIFANRQQLPANEAQACLLQCVDSKTGMVVDGKLNQQNFLNAAKHIRGDSEEKRKESENIFNNCQLEVQKKSAEKCGSAIATRQCIIELSTH